MTTSRGLTARQMLNKVPEVTLYFWIIKVLCTTVGETASDYLASNVGLGLNTTTLITASLLAATLVVQFRLRRYVPVVYWLGIVLISVVGTQITDNLTDQHGVALTTTTTIFSIALACVFAVWYASERTLSIHTIYTTRREAFYWLAVLFTFALGTAAGDLTAERLALGYSLSAALFAAAIAVVAVAHFRFRLNAVAAFWIAYILTRPLGASLGDFLSQPRASGGAGLGTTVTSLLFLGAIVAVVAFLTVTRRDVTERDADGTFGPGSRILVVAHRTATTPALLDAVAARAAREPASVHLLVPNPASHAELTQAERERSHRAAEEVLALALPLLDRVTGHHADGSVSIRHDPMDAIEDAIRHEAEAGGTFQEIIIAPLPRGLSRWLHADLPHRAARFGIPVSTVEAEARPGTPERTEQVQLTP